MMTDHKGRHGGQAAQAKRRGEEWIACTDCTHPRPFRQAEPIVEERPSVWRILGLVVYALAMFAILVYAVPVILLALSNGGSS